jgi:hypothetical protein
MPTTTIQEQLEEVGRQVDRLQARARAGAAQIKPRIQRHVDVLHREEASARAAIRNAPDRAEDRLTRLRTRLEIAEQSLAADVSEDRARFTALVDAELHNWDAYFERLDARPEAREQAAAALDHLHRRRAEVGERLAQLRAASQDAWREQKAHVISARDELEETADELTKQFFGGGDWS